jgi:hypothetical protein
VDTQRLTSLFSTYRSCDFREVNVVDEDRPIESVLGRDGIHEIFGSDQKPDVFILLVLAHGNKDGKICTDDEKYFFTTFQVWNLLKANELLKEAVKINFFGVSP